MAKTMSVADRLEGKGKVQIGDRVLTNYFGVRHEAIVVKVARTRVRLQFYNCQGKVREHWVPMGVALLGWRGKPADCTYQENGQEEK